MTADDRDGLHLTSEAYNLVFNMVRAVIEKTLPKLDPARMLPCMPDSGLFDDMNAEELVSRTQQEFHRQWDVNME